MRPLNLKIFFCSIIFVALIIGDLASAQTAKNLDQTGVSLASEAELTALVKTLKNDNDREKLISHLEMLLQANAKSSERRSAPAGIGVHVVELLSDRMEFLSGEIVAGTNAILDLPNVFNWLSEQVSNPEKRSDWVEIIWKVLLSITAGFVLEKFLRNIIKRPRKVLETKEIDSLWVQFSALIARTTLDVVPIFGFIAGSYTILVLSDPGFMSQQVMVALIIANVVVRVVLALARMILVPSVGSLRIIPIKDVDANYLFIWVRRLTELTVYGFALVQVSQILGLPLEGANAFLKIIGLFVALMLIVFILQNRNLVVNLLRGTKENPGSTMLFWNRVAEIWHVPAVIYVFSMYVVWALAVEDGFTKLLQATLLTLLIIIAAQIVVLGIKRISLKIFALKPEVKERYPGLEARANRYQPIIMQTCSVVVGILAGFTIFEAWGLNAFDWLRTPFGQRITGSLATVIILLAISVMIWEMISAAVERYLSRIEGDVSARAKTLLPLLRTAILVVLVTLVVMVTLSELGLNIGPLLAGAGVIGLAVGFGAQTLVKDIITGLFILIEDHISVGDVVKVGSHSGLVEKLTLRTIQLRDPGGTVHVIPFSEVTTIENLTKDFSRYVFDVGIAYRENTDRVVDVLHELGEKLLKDEHYGELILEPLEVLGVDSFGDNAVVIKARITTKPAKQWVVGREFNRRIKNRFDELGIEMPFPHRTIYFGEDVSGNAPPARITTVEAEKDPTHEKEQIEIKRKRPTISQGPDADASDFTDGD
ncbi:MAG: mechanosensitive ion channel domain-containing protein [Pseudomonadota bacterium]|nr:mechanosensitive ion channel domain-containing protein [Pseudomonadota bacterium]